VSNPKLKVTPGIQVTAFSPVGPVRIAVGYNPYQRPKGPLYYEETAHGGALLCVSPNNDIPTHFAYDQTGAITNVTQETRSGGCPASYQPAVDNRFRSKLTFSFAIGQAF
jgi:outer membrane protein insertion porin family/translocation and assembly module TamA